MALEDLNCDDLGQYLTDNGCHEEVVSTIISNRINGELLLELQEEDLKEMFPVLGDRMTIRKILDRIRQTKNPERESARHNLPLAAGSSSSIAPSFSVSATATTSSSSASLSNLESTNAIEDSLRPIENVNRGNRDPVWHLNFTIPDLNTFSRFVKDAVKTGIVSSTARREITQVLRTYIVPHTRYPTPEQYTTVCRKLVTKYPLLQDTEGTTRIGTWKQSLRNSFKNFRRNYDDDEDPTDTDDQIAAAREPPAKRRRYYNEDEPEMGDEEYDAAIEELNEEYTLRKAGKKGKGHGRVKELMELTKARRVHWICEDKPLISEIIQKFPFLKTNRWLRKEFKAVSSFEEDTSALMEDWPEWRKKIINLAAKESLTRPLLKKILKELEESGEYQYPNDHEDAIAFELLSRLLFPRGFKSAVFKLEFPDCDVDIDAQVEKVDQPEPFLAVVGTPGYSYQVFVCAEGSIFIESNSLQSSIIDLIAAYYVFNIVYPKYLDAILLFFQHCVMKLQDTQRMPNSAVKLVGNLQKID